MVATPARTRSESAECLDFRPIQPDPARADTERMKGAGSMEDTGIDFEEVAILIESTSESAWLKASQLLSGKERDAR